MLDTSDYQDIVDRLIDILGKNINIMNTDGIIIASGDESRIGSFHELAAMVAAENRQIVVNNGQACQFKGVLPGVNMPINFDDEVIGVVGITGNPEEVAGYGKIIKEFVELMVHYKHQNKLDLFQYRAIRDLVKELIRKPDPEPEEISYLENRAALVGFDLNRDRVLLVAEIAGFNDFIVENALTEVKIQGIKQSITEHIAADCDTRDVVFNLMGDRFMILKTASDDIEDFCRNKHQRIFGRLGVRLTFAVGSVCKSVKDYHHAYVTAANLLNIANRLDNVYVLSRDAFDLHLLLYELPDRTKKDYLSQFEGVFSDDRSNMLSTIKVFFECGMNIGEAATKLFVHRNTLIYRLSKFKKLYAMDPLNPYQCMKIYLGIVMKEVWSAP